MGLDIPEPDPKLWSLARYTTLFLAMCETITNHVLFSPSCIRFLKNIFFKLCSNDLFFLHAIPASSQTPIRKQLTVTFL